MPDKNKLTLACLSLMFSLPALGAEPDLFAVLRTPVQSTPAPTEAHRYPNGVEYTGDWKNGLPEGDGALKLPGGSMFLGKFKHGLPNGTGALQKTDGSFYQGEWSQGQRDGLGIMEYPNGNRYEGEWQNGKREGSGTLIFPSGTRFEGFWKNDVRHGRGELKHKTGETYIGDYAQDVPHGYGTIVESDGTTYAGTFSRGKRHGVGDCTDASGHTETCVYEKGRRVEGAAVVARANSLKTRYEPKFEFTEGLSLLWENNFSKGKGLITEQKITFTKRAAMLGSELKLEARGTNFFMLAVVNGYKGPGKYRLSGEDIIVSIDGEMPLLLSGKDSGEVTITADKETTIEGELTAPRLFAHGTPARESIAIRRAQFRALPSDFQTLKRAMADRPPVTRNIHFNKRNSSDLRSHKPLVNGTQPADIEELIKQVDNKGKQQSGEDTVKPHGKR